MKKLNLTGTDVDEAVDRILTYKKSFTWRYFFAVFCIVLVWLVVIISALIPILPNDWVYDYTDPFSDEYFTKSVIVMCLFILIPITILLVRVTKLHLYLYKILLDDCEPRKFIDVVDRLVKERYFRKCYVNAVGTYYIAASAYEKDYEKAMEHIELMRSKSKLKMFRKICMFYQGCVLADTGRVEEAQKCLDKLKEMVGTKTGNSRIAKADRARIIDLEGVIAYAKKDYERAASLYKEAMKTFNNNISRIVLTYGCGNAAYNLGNYTEALKCYSEALEIKPDAKLVFMDDLREKIDEISGL
ncbi:Tetratricopeptide repeat-containing protein [Butyrivibrio sp. ob235]|uniref:tetratricopeptide repeat protein n=1 Tax=Butyrivibrio sp. ob235 TaxID=1761780 RepID=UPI0008D7A172|nr:tetratricopeptide repeat protein [Butyrivibrio sp. ob235]SEL60115.1 Tetratricopeptide repeat-containing protein [Butyrivibrio sp. ob235]